VPGLGATPDRVRRVFSGLLPARAAGSAELAKREVVFDHGALGGIRGFYSVSGVKFTTAGEVARQTLARMGHAERRAEPISELRLAWGTAVLTDSRRSLVLDDAALGAVLRRSIQEESVQCLDDLVLRRANWAVAEPDFERLRSRVAGVVDLPPAAVG
jgi:glycerol-3-phosphate dehydrogenase